MSGFPGLDGPLTMGGLVMTDVSSGTSISLVALDPGLTDAFVIGIYTEQSGDNIRLRQLGGSDELVWQQGLTGGTRWHDNPLATVHVPSSSVGTTTSLEVRAAFINAGSSDVLLYARKTPHLHSFREFKTVSVHSFTATVADDDLQARLGDVFICGVTIGAGVGDAIDLKLGSGQIFWESGTNLGGRETFWFPYPIPTTMNEISNVAITRTPILGDITVGGSGLVTLLYYEKP